MKRIFLSVFILIFTFSTIIPQSILAEKTLQSAEVISLYQVVDEFLLDDSLLIREGTYLYGVHNLESDLINIQFGNKEVQISNEKVIKIEETETDIQPFVDISEKSVSQRNFSKGDVLYGEDGETELLEFITEVNYPVTSDNLFVIGNVGLNISLKQEKHDSTNLESNESEDTSLEDSTEISHEEMLEADDQGLTPEEFSAEEEPIDEQYPTQETEIDEQIDSTEEGNVSQSEEELVQKASLFRITAQSIPKFNSSDKFFKATTDVPVYDNSTGKLVVVGYLKKGEIYPRYESSPSWHQIQFGDGKYFVKKEGTEPSSGDSLKNINTKYKITKDTVTATKDMTVYDNTSGKLVPFGVVKEGEEYAIAYDYGGAWIYVIFADRVGYVKSSELIRNYYPPFGDYFRVLEENLPVYDNSSGELVAVGSLKKGQIYPRYESSRNWHLIQYGNKKLYVTKDGTEPASGDSLKNINEKYSVTNDTVTATTDMIVYDNTSGSLVPFGVIKKGQEYAISHDYGGAWIYVVFADRVGFIKSSELIRNYYPPFGDYFRVLEDNLPVYDNSSGKLVEVGSLKKGEVYPRYESSRNWHLIQFGDMKAYVTKDGTEPANGTELGNENNNQYKNHKHKIVSDVDIVVYDNSSGNLVPFGTIKAGNPYNIAHDYGGKWIYVIFADRIGYVDSSLVEKYGNTYTEYDLSLEDALNIQMRANPVPQTDKYRNSPAYVSKSSVQIYDGGLITGQPVNIRTSTKLGSDSNIYETVNRGTPFIVLNDNVKGDRVGNSTKWYKIQLSGSDEDLYVHSSLASLNTKVVKTKARVNIQANSSTNSHVYATVNKGTILELVNEGGSWHEVKYGTWRNATRNDTLQYLNPTNYINHEVQQFQFLDLRYFTGIPVAELRTLLAGKGTLHGTESIFREAARDAGINELYLISHALLETGNGTSPLAQGIKYNGKTVYNFFGIGAKDNCPNNCGAKRAYEEGWFTIEDAIRGGANFAGDKYINAGQNTLYSMRWNPAAMVRNGAATHQYATDIGWASKQVYYYTQFYSKGEYDLFFDIPVYK